MSKGSRGLDVIDSVYPDPPEEEQLQSGDTCRLCSVEHVGRKRNCIWVNCCAYKSEFGYIPYALALLPVEELKYFCPEHIK
jgi:hypothetical protein